MAVDGIKRKWSLAEVWIVMSLVCIAFWIGVVAFILSHV